MGLCLLFIRFDRFWWFVLLFGMGGYFGDGLGLFNCVNSIISVCFIAFVYLVC